MMGNAVRSITASTVAMTCFLVTTLQSAEWDVQTFANAFDENYARIRNVEASGTCTMLTRQRLDESTAKEESTSVSGDSQYRVSFSLGTKGGPDGSLQSTCKFRLLIGQDGDLLHTVTDTDGPESFFFPRIHLLKDGLLTVYNSDQQRALISRPKQKGVDLPIDPRNALTTRIGLTMGQLLRSDRLQLADVWRTDESVIVAAFLDRDAVGFLTEYHFLETAGLLPIKLIRKPETGFDGVIQEWYCEYQPVLEDSAWFPSAWGFKTFLSADGGADSWFQRLDVAISDLNVNGEVPAERFDMEFATGTLVMNAVTGENNRIVDPPTPAPSRRWLVIVNISVLLAMGTCYLLHQSRSKRQGC